MSRRLLLSILLLPLFVAGCDGLADEPAQAELFQVHLQSAFNDEAVIVEVDGVEVFRGRVTSDGFFDLAAIIGADLSVGEHRLAVTVHGAVRKEATFTIDDIIVVAVTYTPDTQELHFVFLEEEPLYA